MEVNAYAKSTKSARDTQERRYLKFCEEYSVPPLSPSVRDIVMYIAYLSFWLVFGSITNYLSGLNYFLRAHSGATIDYSNFFIRRALMGLRRISGKGRGKARPLFPQDLLKLFSVIDVKIFNDLVFWSAITLAYRCLFRSSNICGSHAVKIRDILFNSRGVRVTVRSSKTNQFGDNPVNISIVEKSISVLCPVKWLSQVIKLSPMGRDNVVFNVRVKGELVAMSYSWFRKRLAEVVNLAGLSGTRISTHSLRRGSTSFMSSIGYGLSDIKRRGCWASNTVLEYIEEEPGREWDKDQLFADNM